MNYLSDQIITYIGNKRSLLNFISHAFSECEKELGKKASYSDLFSGSGVVARAMKSRGSYVLANDLELYSKVINSCYLSNFTKELDEQISSLFDVVCDVSMLKKGFISELYAPHLEENIQKNERVFYTPQNAAIIDTISQNIAKFVPEKLKHYFIAPLLYEASVHANTGGVFKGFYKNSQGIGEFGGEGKNALKRIKGEIKLKMPVFCANHTPFDVLQKDALELAPFIDTDIAYLDPPYNQHPYGSNYFMLNLIASYKRPEQISPISGIAKGWNRSKLNSKSSAQDTLIEIVNRIKSKFIIISYNCEGFVKKESFLTSLEKFGSVKVCEHRYNAFRASRNLASRPTHVHEQLYILKKQ